MLLTPSRSMSRWLNLLGFVAFTGILITLVVSAFVFDVRNVPRADSNGLKDCHGSIPDELRVLQGYVRPAIVVSAKQSPSTSSFAPIPLGETASIIFPAKASGHRKSSREPQGADDIAESPDYRGFATFKVDSDGHYRFAAATGVRTIKVTDYATPNVLILPDQPAGHIPCELTFVSDYHLARGQYIIDVTSNGPNAAMIIIPRTTKWEPSWNFANPL